jgi:hypothetical protein
MSHGIDPAAVYAAAQDIRAGYGFGAEMEAQRRILEANSKGDSRQEAFWQEVSRTLQSPGFFYPGL